MSHLHEMKNFIKVVGSTDVEDDIILDMIDEDLGMSSNPILEKLEDAIFKLDGYYNPEGNRDYNEGLQEGLNMAIELMTRIVDSYK